ncbi:MAG: CPBP family intramembrane metalloprotease [Planctomycetes bacterium]|nr:CPBP family intramembrane metalloprotease [Planctomycetota bacterium]
MASRKHRTKGPLSQLVSFLPGSYLDRTSRPIYALMYLLGFLLFYEVGTFYINPDVLSQSLSRTQLRVVAFIWFQNLLEYIGLSEKMTWIATPFAVIVILLGLQIASRTKWHVRIGDFVLMTIECILLALPLLVLSLAMNRPPVSPATPAASFVVGAVAPSAGHGLWGNIVTGIGAGIYEELVFRLILIILLMMLFQDVLRMEKDVAAVFAVLISAVLFSVHHHFFYVNGHFGRGEQFVWMTFFFRMLAGIYFAAIYILRGFGIVAGTHAFYDILAAVLNAFWFAPEN